MQIHIATANDLAQIVAIYNQAISKGNCTADTETIEITEKYDWFKEHTPEKYPIFVITGEKDKEIYGWCSLSAHRKGRKALVNVAEISYYVKNEQQGKGIGNKLMAHALELAPKCGLHNLFAILLDTNQISIALLEKYGFKKWGHFPDIAEFPDRVCGQFIYGRKV
jgi:phosphinothricin acetyltransferase